MNGEDLINAIAKILDKKNIRCYDSAILNYLMKLDELELNKLLKGDKK